MFPSSVPPGVAQVGIGVMEQMMTVVLTQSLTVADAGVVVVVIAGIVHFDIVPAREYRTVLAGAV